jgi:hypothetical protein
MINELYKLGEVIATAGISADEWHRQLKELRKVSAKSPLFKLSVSENSSISNIEEITDQEQVNKLRKWEPSNGNSFPVINMPNLFLFSKEQVQQKEDWVSGKKHFDVTVLKSWCCEKANNWNDKEITKMEKCLHIVPEQLKQKINKENNKKSPVMELIRLFDSISVDDFRKELKNYIFGKLEKQEDSKMLFRFLFSSNQSNDVQIALDLYNWESFDNPVTNEKTIKWLNSALLKSEKSTLLNLEKSDKRDAFGCEYSEMNEPMPEVKLAGKVGGVKLRSMFHDHLCQYRYGLIDDGSYPINKANRGKIKGALEWLKEPDREGKTWGMVDNDEIIFAYPSIIPQKPIKLATLLGSSSTSTPEKFESIAKDVIQTLKGLPPNKKITNVQIFAIRKMDKARSKVVYFRNHNTEQIIKSAEEWKEGGTNIPSVSFRVWSQNTDNEVKTKPENIGPEIPMPLQIAKIINKVWKMNGKVAGEIKKVKYYQGLELLLEKNRYELGTYLLNTLIQNSQGLIVFLGNLLHAGGVIQNQDKFPRENYHFLPSLIGIMLYGQNRIKEEYMKDVPYLIGQMLKISDELHSFYCKIVRDGNVPPQLVGNSLMASALEAPERMLVQLAQRMKPYIAWAKQYRTRNCEIKGKESWRAGWYMGLFEQNASLFNDDKIAKLKNAQFSDHEKAELFIGYLADFPRKEEAANISN